MREITGISRKLCNTGCLIRKRIDSLEIQVVVPLIENVAKLIVEKIDLLESDVQNVKRKAI